jgi:lambda repressor-like predicted transcriptional regulator
MTAEKTNRVAIAKRHYFMAVAGVEGRAIAKKCKVSPAAVSMVLNGHRRIRRIEDAIALAVGVNHRELWPC